MNGEYGGGDGVVQSRHFGWQPVLMLTCDQVRCPGTTNLLQRNENTLEKPWTKCISVAPRRVCRKVAKYDMRIS